MTEAIDPRDGASPAAAGDVTVLAVDDNATARLMMKSLASRLGYRPLEASDGAEALRMLGAHPEIRVVLLDRDMPGMDGIRTVGEMKKTARFSRIPVVMVTGANTPEEVREGIEAGVFYYLEKPPDPRLLASVLSSALRQSQQAAALQDARVSTTGFDLTDAVRFRFRTPKEAVALAGFVANYFPDPERTLDGIAALLSNAVEHGLCRIGYEAKGALLAQGNFAAELEQRAARLPKGQHATAAVMRRPDGVLLAVTDPGPGFNWRDYMQIDMSRSAASHGRGILRARATAFDELKFNESGNQVAGLARPREEFEW
ncbi:response regulator [Mangrovicoccus sp. HB161399]|uniref:response regulator n=1 Tax=Mangrovicoccus sp. HB161399 TaxID=2720392 RepID=UPI00155698A5|nr:response regulator [Mangrovicoccus sp. HB161399]